MITSVLRKFCICLMFLCGKLFAQSDEPCAATELIVGSLGSCSGAVSACINPPAFTNSTSASSGVSLPAISCGGFNTTTFDFWYKAVVPASGKLNVVVSDNGTGAQVSAFWDMALYTSSNSRTCTGSVFTQIASECTSANYPNLTVIQPAGTVVYIRMWREAASLQTANRCYKICANDPPNPPGCTTLVSPANGALNTNAPEILLTWRAATGATSYNVYFSSSNPPGFAGNIADTAAIVNFLSFNTTYFWSIVPLNTGGAATGCTVYSFTTRQAPSPPVNDECVNATTLTSYAPLNGTTVSATRSLAATPCLGDTGVANDDVWYKFTALQSGSASITVTPTLALDPVIVVYSGTCASPTTLACADNGADGDPETVSLTNLVKDSAYFLRVYSYDVFGAEGDFTISAAGVALPVTLTNLQGERSGLYNKLSWTTLAEVNNTGYEVQRSEEGSIFTTITFLPSKSSNGNSSTLLNYHFNDLKPLSGANYYRLKQIDKDGRFALSNIVSIKGIKPSIVSMVHVYPNPVKSTLNIVLSSPDGNNAQLIITDLAGKVLIKKPATLVGGDNSFKILVATLPSGTYFIKAICSNGCETAIEKFVKE